ncbi:hypothetical protein HELRODRAFT_167275 [Helobdella robusta]|uniref:Uncharacterized protein n=1 Tax=Helobdella robusta TaxID=6412 RepID=T1EZ77_HELRO|nr:hypothetical protein HELRODRAFT_167275 [Helobdella robusta]ESO10777.1 hypothetical protein HELRODRAFT_167275 [Helobdella robusta]
MAVNEYLVRCFQKAGIPVIKEPMGLIEEGAFRPDGYTITPWAQGRSLAWDVTLPHTMADRYIGYTSVEAGTAALKASDFKNENCMPNHGLFIKTGIVVIV